MRRLNKWRIDWILALYVRIMFVSVFLAMLTVVYYPSIMTNDAGLLVHVNRYGEMWFETIMLISALAIFAYLELNARTDWFDKKARISK